MLHPKPWHRRAQFFRTPPFVPVDREQRAQILAKAKLQRRPGRVSANALRVLEVMLKAIGPNGQLDLSHQTIADRALCKLTAAKDALKRLRQLGFLDWFQRLKRVGTRTAQDTNAYVLCNPSRCEAVLRLEVRRISIPTQRGVDPDRLEAARQLRILGVPVPPEWGIEKAALEQGGRTV